MSLDIPEKGYIIGLYELHTNHEDSCMKKIKGIVEGFYGTPWTNSSRKRILQKIGTWGFNTYIYAPKDDKYHRSHWAESYPDNEFIALIELADYCKIQNIDFFFTISPGIGFSYSSQQSFLILISKITRFYKNGVRNFGILFDDIPFSLQDEEDIMTFQSIGNAQNRLLRKVFKALRKIDDSIQLITCPTEYYGTGDSDYIKEFCFDLPKEILVAWTGRETCAQTLSANDANYFTESTGHVPLYWDNYPVNDSIMKWEMHLGPYSQRDKNLLNVSDGIILNVMEYPYSSLISLKTAADFFSSPGSYNPWESWENAIYEIVNKQYAEEFKNFAAFNFKSCIYPYFSNKQMLEDISKTLLTPSWDFKKYITKFLKQNMDSFKLLKKNKKDPIINEIYPWLKKYKIFLKYTKYYSRVRCGTPIIKLISLVPKWVYFLKYLLNQYDIFQLEILDQM